MPGESQQTPGSAPDPTVLTTEQLLREVENATRTLEAKINGLETRMDIRFSSVDRHLALVEQQRVEQKADTKAAVDAALTAQKEAVKEQTTASGLAIAKSEAATAKQLEGLGTTFATAIKGVTDILADVKDRVGKIEAIKQGATDARAGISAGAQIGISALGLLVAILTVAVVVLLANAG